MTVGSVPNTQGMDLTRRASGSTARLRPGRPGVPHPPGVYAAGDCTGVLMLASVAAMQGRIAMWHALGEAVPPLKLLPSPPTSSPTPRSPPSARRPTPARPVDGRGDGAAGQQRPGQDAGRPRRFREAVRLPDRHGGGRRGGRPAASELIHPVALAVGPRLTVDQVAQAFTVYPSVSGSVAEAARQLHTRVWRD